MGFEILNPLSDSIMFVFGIIPNIFNLAYPEAYFIASKGYFNWIGRILKFFTCVICLFIPFSWAFLLLSLFIIRKLVNISDSFESIIQEIDFNLVEED